MEEANDARWALAGASMLGETQLPKWFALPLLFRNLPPPSKPINSTIRIIWDPLYCGIIGYYSTQYSSYSTQLVAMATRWVSDTPNLAPLRLKGLIHLE